jgi:hypothetical protein
MSIVMSTENKIVLRYGEPHPSYMLQFNTSTEGEKKKKVLFQQEDLQHLTDYDLQDRLSTRICLLYEDR